MAMTIEASQDKDRVLEQRIRERAYKIWENAGRPEGRQLEHWELAQLAIAEQDALPTMMMKVPSLAGQE